jgi:tetratricopeptide (TPR) repeat protein
MDCRRLRLWVSLGVLTGAGWLIAQQQPMLPQQPMLCHTMEATGAIDDPTKLPAPQKMTGIGNGSIAITAANDDAKMWFNQGLNLMHDFWDYESLRAFEQSVRSDPKCAMCYWGVYQAASFRGNDIPWAADALKKADKLKKHSSKAEQLYIKATVAAVKEHAARSNHGPNTGGGKDEAYKDSRETKILRELVALQPDDIQSRVFLAESMMSGFDKKGEPKQGTAQGQQLLVAILKDHPDDSAANHYWIHAVEPGNHPELALESSRKLGALTPNSGHMVHMPGHIFYRTGDYETARISFEDSVRVDEAYMKAQNVTVANDWNYVHNLMYLIANLAEAGRLAEATEISEKLTKARGESGPTLYRQTPRDGLTRLNVELPVMLRAGDWKAATNALEASTPDADLKNLAALREAMLNYTRGMLALEHDGVKAARQSADALDAYVKAKPATPAETMPQGMMVFMAKDAMAKPIHSFMDVASMELTASVLLAEGRGVESEAMFVKAADAERALGYREPPMYIRPVGETRGDALLRAGRFDEAKAAYEAALKERPNSGYPLFGIAQADAAAKRPAQATADYAKLMQVWASADADLPQMRAARAWIAGQTANGE